MYMTEQRKKLFEFFKSHPDMTTSARDLAAQLVAEEHAKISVSAVYRNLAMLEREGLIEYGPDQYLPAPFEQHWGATVALTPEAASGTADVTFRVDTSELGGRSLVAFETLAHDGRTVATHADINDRDQTIHVPSIGTELTGPDGGHSVVVADSITITDTVAYSNLVPGATYTLRGTLVDKTSGQPLVERDGTAVTAEATFTPDAPDGTADVSFEVPGELVSPGKEYVAFEECLHDETSVAVHADIDDAGQTIAFVAPEKEAVPATGDGGAAAALALALAGTTVAVAGVLLARRKRNATSG